MGKFLAVAAAACLALSGSNALANNPVRTVGTEFRDAEGRTLILRGVNLGGSSKLPFKTSADPAKVSYVGRPFPLAQADEHFSRLKSWGLTTIRLIVMWEAVEHAGPGEYDQAYLDYLRQLVMAGDKYGMKFIVDLHQDFYSRATGGDGAPYWTVTRLGLGPDRTNEPGAPHKQPKRGPGYWPPTAARYSVNTMDTLFWAGNDFAPGLKVDNVPVQEWLQDHYVGSIRQVAVNLKGLDNVIAYDTYNEPNHGYIGVSDLREPEFFMEFVGKNSAPGVKSPSYWDLMQAASGFRPEARTVAANNLWSKRARDIWRQYGVWDVVDGKPKLLKPDYFAKLNGQTPDHPLYVAALQRKIAQKVREVAPDTLILQQPAVGNLTNLDLGLPGMVSQPHWYDGVVLMSKKYEPNVTYAMTGWPSVKEVRLEGRDKVLADYLKRVQDLHSLGIPMGGLPTLIGETGLPYDLNDNHAYKTGDFSAQETLAGLMYETLDRTLSSYIIWNYTSDNDNVRGDQWGNEDLSIYSRDQRKPPLDINAGGRAIRQVVRPYPTATAGKPASLSFDPETRTFEYRYTADQALTAPTEIFVPEYQYPKGFNVDVRNGRYAQTADRSKIQIVDAKGEVVVKITRR